ncbi:CheY-like protein, partial [Parathielavia hyrcaniae]
LLLVDDNPVNIKLLFTLIKKLKQPFEIARNGLEAVERYKESLSSRSPRLFDIVFMDVIMPVMDGFEATRQIRQLELEHMVAAGEGAGKEKCKIIALTGLSSDSDRREAAASGCDMFWTKPIRLDALRKFV